MPDPKRRTNPLLLLFVILLCLSSTVLFRHSAFDPDYQNRQSSVIDRKGTTPDKSSARSKDKQEDKKSAKDTAVTSTPAPTATAKPTEAPAEAASVQEASPEAASGVWTSSGSSWLFMVDDQPYTGWLTDTDLKHYYFNSDGIMQTGWVEDQGHKYYMDQDGIMQTGTVTIDGQTYTFNSDGTLEE